VSGPGDLEQVAPAQARLGQQPQQELLAGERVVQAGVHGEAGQGAQQEVVLGQAHQGVEAGGGRDPGGG
jgi:hypothetical protein